jgi:hypothetical protein
MNSVNVVFTSAKQDEPLRGNDTYAVFASGLKRAPHFGRLLGSVSLFIPAFEMHVWVRWIRDERGCERIVMPRLEVTGPDGRLHRKTLVRFHSAQAEQRFQRAALAAVHQLLGRTTSVERRI